MVISIIIPVLNEAKIIQPILNQLQQYDRVEIIVVDGGSQDDTVAIAVQTGVKVISIPKKNRAAQMNAGANIACGEILLFLHADTKLPSNFVELVIKTLEPDNVVVGAFDLAIEGSAKSLRLIEFLVRVRSHLFSLPYGDQAIFISKAAFVNSGGFANLPIMEDFEFIRRIRKQGIAIAPATVTTSGRRWQKLGVWKTTLINQAIIVGYYLGVSPNKLSKFYRDRGKNNSQK